MACTDVAKVKAKATVINLIILSSNVKFKTFVRNHGICPSRNISSSVTTSADQNDAVRWASSPRPSPGPIRRPRG